MAEIDVALKHETRRMIYNHIIQYPGVTFNVLKNVFGLSDGTLRYHIDYLLRAGKIKDGLGTGRRVYYPASTMNIPNTITDGVPVNIKMKRVHNQIINIIRKNPGINQEQLIKRTKLNRNKLRKNCKKLMELGMIKKQTLSNTVCFECISEGEMQYEILKTMLKKLINGEIDEETFLGIKKRIEEG